MKKLIFAAFVSFTSFNVLAQKVALSRVAELTIPEDAKPVVREKLYSAQKKSDESVIALTKDKEGLYEIGNILIKVTPLEGQVDKSSFKDMEYDFAEDKKYATFFNLTRPVIQNASAVCAQYEPKNSNTGRYFFMAINSAYTKQLSIFMEYDIADRDKADKIFRQILKTVKMK